MKSNQQTLDRLMKDYQSSTDPATRKKLGDEIRTLGNSIVRSINIPSRKPKASIKLAPEPGNHFTGHYMGCGGQILESDLKKYENKNWCIEPKHDGIWGSAVSIGGKTRFFSRTNTEKFMDLPDLPDGTILVGELGYGSQVSKQRTAIYGHEFMDVIDILFVNGNDIRNLPDDVRRKVLVETVKTWSKTLQRHYRITERKYTNFRKFFNDQIEGVVLKRIGIADSEYIVGMKCPRWLKLKREYEVDAIITGYEISQAESHAGFVEAIKCSVYRNGKLVEISSLGALTDFLRRDILKNWKNYKGRVVEISCNYIFDSGALRHPRLKTIRAQDDKPPKDCTWEAMIALKPVIKG